MSEIQTTSTIPIQKVAPADPVDLSPVLHRLEAFADQPQDGILTKPEPGTDSLEKRNLINAAASVDWTIQSTLAIYPEDHPASVYMKNLLQRLSDPEEETFNIHVFAGEPNAFVLPNGSIYISDGLIRFAETEEEILFVLQHEKEHVRNKHALKEFETKLKSTSKRSLTEYILSLAGQSRYAEWEADVSAMDQLEKRGINPLGGINLIERFRTNLNHGGEISIVHGREADRVINLRTLTYLRDITTITDPLISVDTDVRDSLSIRGSLYQDFIQSWQRRSWVDLKKCLQRMDGKTAIILFTDVLETTLREDLSFTSESAKNWARVQKKTVGTLAKIVWEYVATTSPTIDDKELSTTQQKILFYAILDLVGEAESANDSRQKVMFESDNGSNFSYNKFALGRQMWLSPEELLDVFRPEIWRKMGLIPDNNPKKFVRGLARQVLVSGMLEDEEGLSIRPVLQFAADITDRFLQLYEECGVVGDRQRFLYSVYDTFISEAIELSAEIGLDENSLQSESQSFFSSRFRIELPESLENDIHKRSAQDLISEYQECIEQMQRQRIKDSTGSLVTKKDGAEIFKLNQDKFTKIFARFEQEGLDSFLKLLTNFRSELQNDSRWTMSFENNLSYFSKVVNDYVQEKQDVLMAGLDSKERNFRFLEIELLSGNAASHLEYGYLNAVAELVERDDCSIEDFARLYALSKSREYKLNGLTIQVDGYLQGDNEDVDNYILRAGLYKICCSQLDKFSSNRDFADFLEYVTVSFPLNHYGYEGARGLMDEEEKFIVDRKTSFLREVFDRFDFDLQDPTDLKTFYYLTTYFEDISLSVRMQNQVLKRLIECLSFEEGLAFFEQEIDSSRLLSLESFNLFIDTKAVSHEQIKRAQELLLRVIASERVSVNLGKVIGTEFFSDFFFKRSKRDFLKAIIGNGRDDRAIKEFLYRRWRGFSRGINGELRDNVNLDEIIMRLYRFDAQSKYVLLRNLLVGEGGVLMGKDSQGIHDFIDFLLDEYVSATTQQEQILLEGLKDVLYEVVQQAPYDLIYFALAPILQNQILISSSTEVGWEEIVRNTEIASVVEELEKKYQRKISQEDIEKARLADDERKRFMSDYPDLTMGDLEIIEEWDYVDMLDSLHDSLEEIEDMIPAILKAIGAGDADAETRVQPGDRDAYEQAIQNYLQQTEGVQKAERPTVTQFVLELFQKLGAPGVRSLQIAGQYVELPVELQEAFRDVYDRVQGQSKITAHKTMLREIPEAAVQYSGLGDRLGGGSLMTVFETTPAEGSERVAKALNPNAEFHAETSFQVLQRAFTALAEQNPVFAYALPILEDIRAWIRADINFDGFIEKDARFRSIHDGFNDGSRYSVAVPQTHRPESKYVTLEDFVEGCNLTDLEKLKEQGHDLRQIVSLVTKNLFAQIEDGQVLSDIHPGNIRVSGDKVFFLDRNFYLEMDENDLNFFRGLLTKIKSPSELLEHTFSYLNVLGYSITDDQKVRILDSSVSIGRGEDVTDRLMKAIVALRKEGIKLPLKITLLIKNIYYLDRLARKVGFENILEAYLGHNKYKLAKLAGKI